LLYAHFGPVNRDLFLVDGASVRNLTGLDGLEYHPAPTPDGRYIVFTREQGGDPDLWILDLQGGPARPLYESDDFEDSADISPDGRHIAFVSDRGGTAEIYVAPFRPDQPAAANRQAFARARLLTSEEGSDFRPAFSPDGRFIAYSSTRGLPFSSGSQIWVVAVDPATEGGASRRLVAEEGWNGSPAWSADGKFIAYHQLIPDNTVGPVPLAAGGVWQVEVATGKRQRLSDEGRMAVQPTRRPGGGWLWSERSEEGWRLHQPAAAAAEPAAGEASPPKGPRSDQDLMAPVFLKDGRVVAYGPGPAPAGDPMVPILPPIVVPGFRHLRQGEGLTLDLLPLYAAFPELSPDHRTLATGVSDLQLVEMATGKKRDLFRPPGVEPDFPSVWNPSWSPDGQWLVVSGGPGFAPAEARVDLWRVAADGSQPVNLTADSPANDASGEISPDGKWIVFRSGRSGQMDLHLMDADGANVRRLTDDPAVDTMPSFSPDGRQVAFASTRTGNHEIFVLTLDESGEVVGEPRQITDSPGFDVHPAWSPDGKWLVVTTDRWGWNDEIDFVLLNFQPYGELAATRLEDLHVVRLTHNNWEEGQAEWLKVGLDEVLGVSATAPSR
jgi:Tol biopolymer transport system component